MTDAGEVLFGGIGGLTVIRPNQLTHHTYDPPIVLTNIRVGGKAVISSSFNGKSSGSFLRVGPDANNILVEFAALDYAAPEHCRYAYRLEGYDKSWVETDAAHRQAAYTNLPPGDYVLRVRGRMAMACGVDSRLRYPFASSRAGTRLSGSGWPVCWLDSALWLSLYRCARVSSVFGNESWSRVWPSVQLSFKIVSVSSSGLLTSMS